MPEIPLGLSFEEGDSGFILRRKDTDETVTTFPLSAEEVFALKVTIALWSDRMVQASQAESGAVHAVIAHPIGRVGLMTDALKANVLAIMEAPSGERMNLSLPPAVARYLLESLPQVLAELDETTPARQ